MMRASAFVAVGLALCAAGARGQTAAFSTFGAGCGAAGQMPVLSAQDLPRLGQPFTLVMRPPGGCGFIGNTTTCRMGLLSTGGSRSSHGGVALPWPIPAALAGGRTDCALLCSPDLLVPGTDSRVAPETFATLPLPNVPALLGARIYHQWILYVETRRMGVVVARSLLVSNGGESTLGT